LTVRPVRATALAAGFVIVRVKTELVLTPTLVGAKPLVIVGGTSTFKVAEAAVPVPSPEVFVTVLVVLAFGPDAAAVTLMLMAQLLLAAIEPPVRLRLVDPAVFPVTVPPQVLEKAGVPAT
jgi:hypothetical protein